MPHKTGLCWGPGGRPPAKPAGRPCLASRRTKKQPVPEWTPKRAAGLVTRERSVSKLSGEVALFVHFAIGAFRHNSVATSLPQDSRRHHPGLNERIRIFDRHVVSEFISNTREFLDDVHVGGMEEASSPQPRR